MKWRTPAYRDRRRQQPRWRPRPLRVIAALLLIAVMGYAAAVLYLLTQETRLVFEAGQTLSAARPDFRPEQIEVPRPDGARQLRLVMRSGGSDDGAWVLFLHGNAATIASRVNIAHYTELGNLGVNVMAPESRGFAGLDGVPTGSCSPPMRAPPTTISGRSAHVEPGRIVILRLPCRIAVAVGLAAETQQAAVILKGAPASLADVGRQRYPFFPQIRLLMRNPFDSIRRIANVRAPLLFLHSPEDAEWGPPRFGRAAVVQADGGQDVRRSSRRPRQRDHSRHEALLRRIRTFLTAHRLVEADDLAASAPGALARISASTRPSTPFISRPSRAAAVVVRRPRC